MRYLFIVCFCFGCANAGQLKIDLSAPNAILINGETGAVLFEKGAHERVAPASTTKVATLIYALQKKREGLDEIITASADAVGSVQPGLKIANPARFLPYRLEPGGTHMGIKLGEQLPYRALLYGLMLVSANDAANVIAERVSGSVPAFMGELATFLKSIGCTHTTFLNPHGLHDARHLTTAHEMAKITAVGLKDPLFREIVKTTQYMRPQTNKQPQSVMGQLNRLMKPGAYFYPKAIGVKTGHHSNSGYNLVAAAEKEGRTLVAVVMGCPDSARRFKDTIRLFEAAFAEAKTSRTLLSKEFDRFSLSVPGGKEAVDAELGSDLQIEYYPSEEPVLKAMLRWDRLALPIAKGQKVGQVELKMGDGSLFKSVAIYAAKQVEKTLMQEFKELCARFHIKQVAFVLAAGMIGAGIILFYRKRRALAREQ
jgi:D-alanyl-D-alanine carboxypeptidase (penicillin-binding protein 5/6)